MPENNNAPVPGKASANELAALDFKNLIGGPLNAVVEAQINSSQNTLNFIDGLKADDGTMQVTTFKYKKHVTTNGQADAQDMELTVPLLTLLPIPFLRIEYVNIKFNAHISSMSRRDVEEIDKKSLSVHGSGGFPFFKVDVKASISNQRTQKDHAEEKRSFSMEVQVHAVQEAMPGGMEKVLTMLEHSIAEKPAK